LWRARASARAHDGISEADQLGSAGYQQPWVGIVGIPQVKIEVWKPPGPPQAP
jgi:hypothetical protein